MEILNKEQILQEKINEIVYPENKDKLAEGALIINKRTGDILKLCDFPFYNIKNNTIDFIYVEDSLDKYRILGRPINLELILKALGEDWGYFKNKIILRLKNDTVNSVYWILNTKFSEQTEDTQQTIFNIIINPSN